jgi:hypothetical protein
MIILYISLGFIIAGLYCIVMGLCHAAAKPAPKPTGIGRCSFAEGRPTMPSEPEDSVEQARRLR